VPNTAQSSHNPRQERRHKPAPAAGRRMDLYLLSGDDGLLLELGPLLGDRYRSRPIDAADQIDAGSLVPWLLIIDAIARTDARAQAARIEQQHPLAPLLVICADGKSTDWASPLARGMVSAVVERGALATALPEALTAIELRMQAAATAITSNAFADLAGPDRPAGKRRVWMWAAAVLLLAAAASWYFMSRDATRTIRPAGRTSGAVGRPIAIPGTPINTAAPATPAPAAITAPPASLTPAPAAGSAPAPHRTVLELLSDARVAFRDERSQLPGAEGSGHGDSALELYGAVLAQDPQNEEARDGMQRLFSVARARIQSDLAAGKPDDAARLVAVCDDVVVSLDGPREVHDLIRNVPRAFDRLAAGVAAVRAAGGPGTRISGRCTVQRANFHALRATVAAARAVGLERLSFLAADVTSEMEYQPPAGISVSLSGDDDTLHDYWDKLSAGGTTTMPLQKQVWGDEFGMCVDQFGVPWLVNISQQA